MLRCPPLWVLLCASCILLCTAAQAQTLQELQIVDAGVGLPGITELDGSSLFITHIGTVTSQGDAASNAAAARGAFGVDGSGIKIGVISDSFNKTGAAVTVNTQIMNGNLPGIGNPNGYTTSIQVVKDSASGGDEGRALMEIIHDLAPGAELMFHSAFNNFTDGATQLNSIANAIDALVANGADIIIDDVALANQPFFQDGPTTQAVNAAKAAGVAYFTSSGNYGSEAWRGAFNGGIGGTQDFDLDAGEGGDTTMDILVPQGGMVQVLVQWDDPYPSISGGTASDFDVRLFDPALNSDVDSSNRVQGDGLDPWERIIETNPGPGSKQYGVIIEHVSGDTDHDLKIIVLGGSISDDDDTNDPTMWGHKSAEGAVSVAAHRHNMLNNIEPFSSIGPVDILFDGAGNPIFDLREGPLITAPDGVSTTTTGYGTFFGTSAAAPHVAAVAALMLERASDLGVMLTVDNLYQILFDTAVDIETLGFDYESGYGRLDALAAVNGVPEPASLVIVACMSALAASRRRSR